MTTQERLLKAVESQIKSLFRMRRMSYLNGIPYDIFDKGLSEAAERLWPEYERKSELELLQEAFGRTGK